MMLSRFEDLQLPADIPNELRIIINSTVNETDTLAKQTFAYRVWNGMYDHMTKSLKIAKASGRYNDCPAKITKSYMESVIGLSQEQLIEHLYQTMPLMPRYLIRALYGRQLEIEHRVPQWIQYHMQWATTYNELMRVHHHS